MTQNVQTRNMGFSWRLHLWYSLRGIEVEGDPLGLASEALAVTIDHAVGDRLDRRYSSTWPTPFSKRDSVDWDPERLPRSSFGPTSIVWIGSWARTWASLQSG